MGEIRLPGLSTGIDTKKLIEQLMALQREQLNMYEERKTKWEDKQDALNTLENKMGTLNSTLSNISDAQKLRSFSTSSSDTDILTAEASYSAFEGNHTVQINQLANAERWVHTNGIEYSEDRIGAGTFIYSYNNQETTITTTAQTTLEDLAGLINNDADNPGVTANLLFYKDAYHLVLSGNDAGSDYNITINSSNTEVLLADSTFTDESNATLGKRITELDQFSGTLVGDEKITITGTDHNGNSVSGEISITSDTKLTHLISEINDAFDGRAVATLENGKIKLTDSTTGTSQLQLSLSYDPGSGSSSLSLPTMNQSTEGGSVTADLTGFAESDFTATQSAQNSKIKVDGYPTESPVSEVQKLTTTSGATAGTFTLTYDGKTTDPIAYDATTDDIQSALEALSNVSSGDITVSGDNLTVDSGETTFQFASSLGDVSLISLNPSGLTPSDNSNYTMTEQTQGTDGWIDRSSNTIDDVINGVTLHLHDTGSIQVNLTRNIESIKENLNSMVEAYNSVVSFIQEKTGYNQTLMTGGVLMGDHVVRILESQLQSPLYTQTSGFVEDIDTFTLPVQIGFELDKNGLLSLDSSTFDEAIAEDYMGTLALIGAEKTGSTDSNTIEFYDASSKYTTAGNYDIEVTISGGSIESAKIKYSTESTYRDATIDGNIVTGDSTFDDDGDPLYPENGLQLSIDTSQDGTYTATVRVKQGFAGAIEETLESMLKVTVGTLQIDQEHVDDQIENLQKRIEDQQERLAVKKQRLIDQFIRLEKTLTILNSQMSALGMSTS